MMWVSLPPDRGAVFLVASTVLLHLVPVTALSHQTTLNAPPLQLPSNKMLVSTPEDVINVVQNYESAWRTLTDMCGKTRNRCMNSCGEKATLLESDAIVHHNIDVMDARLTCSCDYVCMVHGDCCFDFFDACPNEVAKFYQSPLSKASSVCHGYYSFLVHGTPNMTAKSSTVQHEKKLDSIERKLIN
ncbi:hypothetical protein ElyMa_006469200 [Elysia marginata]|uniref:SMB domain-containing protein n=1 Tax=Elysia marginata TaxID=1093978 RepID=A0AAV4I313_9GAST|nr:hypothetical protein ElyMa_006469200 [Elysia marginata]